MRTSKERKIRVLNKRFPGIWDQNPRPYSELNLFNEKYLSLQKLGGGGGEGGRVRPL